MHLLFLIQSHQLLAFCMDSKEFVISLGYVQQHFLLQHHQSESFLNKRHHGLFITNASKVALFFCDSCICYIVKTIVKISFLDADFFTPSAFLNSESVFYSLI